MDRVQFQPFRIDLQPPPRRKSEAQGFDMLIQSYLGQAPLLLDQQLTNAVARTEHVANVAVFLRLSKHFQIRLAQSWHSHLEVKEHPPQQS